MQAALPIDGFTSALRRVVSFASSYAPDEHDRVAQHQNAEEAFSISTGSGEGQASSNNTSNSNSSQTSAPSLTPTSTMQDLSWKIQALEREKNELLEKLQALHEDPRVVYGSQQRTKGINPERSGCFDNNHHVIVKRNTDLERSLASVASERDEIEASLAVAVLQHAEEKTKLQLENDALQTRIRELEGGASEYYTSICIQRLGWMIEHFIRCTGQSWMD